jgi:hypothetical protein
MASRNPRLDFYDPQTLERMHRKPGGRWSDRSRSASAADCGEPISPRPLISQPVGAERRRIECTEADALALNPRPSSRGI